MRGFRSTLVLLVVFLGLLGYIYFYEMKKPPAGEEAPKQKVFSVESDKIEEIQVKAASGDRTVLKKRTGTWDVVEPIQASADEGEVSGILTNLASLELQRVVDENPADLAQYGLAAPRVDLAFRKTGEATLVHLFLGDKTATGGDMYAKLPGEKRVFLVSGFLDTTFNRSTFDLRDKSILKFPRDKVDMVDVVAPDRVLALAKAGEGWKLVKPVEARADLGAAEGLIGRIQSAQMKSIAAADVPAADLGQYGLDKPAEVVTIGAGSTRAVLEVGKAAASGTVFARDASRPMVFTIDATLVDDLKKPADEYRPKNIFDARPFNVTRVEVTRDGTTLAFEMTKDKNGQFSWQLLNPTRKSDDIKMQTFLEGLTGLTAQSWADAKTTTGLDKPVLTVVATSEEGKKVEKVTFGKAGNDVYAARATEPDAARVDTAAFDAVVKSLDALK